MRTYVLHSSRGSTVYSRHASGVVDDLIVRRRQGALLAVAQLASADRTASSAGTSARVP